MLAHGMRRGSGRRQAMSMATAQKGFDRTAYAARMRKFRRREWAKAFGDA